MIVATKANGLEERGGIAGGALAGAAVMTVLNGLGAEEVVARHGEWASCPRSRSSPARSTRTRTSSTSSIPRRGSALYRDAPYALAQEAGELIGRSGLAVEVLPDLRPAQWSKLIFNATVNGVAALTGLPHDFHFAEEEPGGLGRLVRGLMDEGKTVAAAARVDLHDDPWEMNVLATQRGPAHFPSMLEDVEAGRATEIELINGALVREARTHGVEAPLQEAVYALVRGREAAYR